MHFRFFIIICLASIVSKPSFSMEKTEKGILKHTIEVYSTLRANYGIGKTLNMLQGKTLFSEVRYPRAQLVSNGIKLVGVPGVLEIVNLENGQFRFRGVQLDFKNQSAEDISKAFSSFTAENGFWHQPFVPEAHASIGFLGGAVYALGAAAVGMFCGLATMGSTALKSGTMCTVAALSWPIMIPLLAIGSNVVNAIDGVSNHVKKSRREGRKKKSEKLREKVLSFPKKVECLEGGGLKVLNSDGSAEKKRWNSRWKRRHVAKACKNYPDFIAELNNRLSPQAAQEQSDSIHEVSQ